MTTKRVVLKSLDALLYCVEHPYLTAAVLAAMLSVAVSTGNVALAVVPVAVGLMVIGACTFYAAKPLFVVVLLFVAGATCVYVVDRTSDLFPNCERTEGYSSIYGANVEVTTCGNRITVVKK